MSALDNLPPDQRAVLQMVLQRGRSYEEIASLLSIERAAVRQRALDAFDALSPATVIPGPESALVTDYLLGQLPERVAEQVFTYLRASEADRAWAEALATVIAPLASAALPEIPVGAPLGADDSSGGGLRRDSESQPAEPAVASEPEPPEPEVTAEPTVAGELPWSTGEGSTPPAGRGRPQSSRRGGAILLGSLAAMIIAAILVVVLVAGGGNKQRGATRTASTTAAQDTGTATQPTGTSAQTTSTTVPSGTSTTTQILAQLNLTSPSGAKSTLGVVQVVRLGSAIGVAVYAKGVPANTQHNAYALWLYNSPTSYQLQGFIPSLVGKNGIIDTGGKLKPGASRYHRLLITLETQPHPSTPGEVVLSGPFREHP